MEHSTTQNNQHPVKYAFVAAIVALLFWSGTAIANKIAVQYMDGLTAGILRSMLAGLFAIIIAFSLKFSFPRSLKELGLLAISGLASFAVWPVLMSVGIERTTAGHAALVMALIPIFTVLIAASVEYRFPKTGWWVGATVALFATAILIINQNNSLQLNDGSTIKGDLIVLAGGIICAVGYVAGGKLSPRIGTAATTFWGLSIALAILVPAFIIISDNTEWVSVAGDGWLAIAWMTFFSSLAGYALWFYSLGRAGIGRIGSLQLAMPAITLVLATIILRESVNIFLIVICASIVIGTFIAQKYAR